MSYRLAPLQLFLVYTAFAFGCLFLGPISYRDLDVVVVVAYVSAFLLLFGVGYRLGVGGPWDPGDRSAAHQTPDRTLTRVIWPLLLWGVASSVYAWVGPALTGQTISLTELGESYIEGYRGYVRGTATIDAAYIITIFDYAIVTLAVLLGLGNFARLKGVARTATIFILSSYVLTNILYSGKQKYLGDAVVFLAAAFLVSLAVRRARVRVRTVVLTALAAVVVTALFAEMLRQRYTAAGIGLENVLDKAHPRMTWDTESMLFQFLGPEYGFASGIFLNYFSNGLYGLSLSLSLPFEWSYFAGSSYSLGRIVEIGFDAPGAILEHTYPYRVGETYGWGFDQWHSAFSWIASDLSFPGILALSPLAGFVYGRVWKRAVAGSNPFATPLFCYLSLGMVFAYSNNQMVHSLAGVFVLLFLLVSWSVRELTVRAAAPGSA